MNSPTPAQPGGSAGPDRSGPVPDHARQGSPPPAAGGNVPPQDRSGGDDEDGRSQDTSGQDGSEEDAKFARYEPL